MKKEQKGIVENVSALNLKKSNEIFDGAKEHTPGGLLGIRHPGFYVINEYPMFIQRGYDGHVVDVDGNDYIDMMAAYGPVILGYNEEEINKAVIDRLQNGFCFTLCQEAQKILSDKLAELIPSAEMTMFVKTGSDATTIAVKVARGFTGKEIILRCGYHGWHDWCVEPTGGVPKAVQDLTRAFPYGNLETLEKILKENEDNIAGIIMCPLAHSRAEKITEPPKGYLQGVRELADKYKAVLIFDEIRTGFRMSLGGAQKYYDVIPDLSTFGKAMANGFAISACVGKAKFMKIVEKDVYISSTFFPNSLEMVAALKCIEIMERENVIEDIWEKGRYFEKEMTKIIQETGAPAYFSGIPTMPYVLFKKCDAYEERTKLFFTEMIRRGILQAPYHHWYISYRHTKEDLDIALKAAKNAFIVVNERYPV